MKTRLSFVSNSSSSSFIIISDRKPFEDLSRYYNTNLIIDSNFGWYEFGWKQDEYYDFGTKAIFARLQADYVHNKKWIKMLNEVIITELKLKSLSWNLIDAYIDHQSASYEGKNTEMFENRQQLSNFLFSPCSSIRTDNDNY
jgi:hypothetical protein